MATLAQRPSFTRFQVKPATPRIGAFIEGIDLREELPDEVIAEIRQALLTYKVIFLRDQDITQEQHVAFARRFGDLEVHPMSEGLGQEIPEIFHIRTRPDGSNSGANMWHSDVTWRACPSLGSVLRARIIPEVGGDTLWSDQVAAYEGLSPAMKQWVCTLTAIHDGSGFARYLNISEEEWFRRFPLQEHPVVRTHPETGKRALYVNAAFTRSIKGLSRKESDWLLEHLFAQAAIPEYQVRLRWEPNTIAFWDNRSCQHYAVADYAPAMRHVERVTIIGDKPFFDPSR
ncbi:MAG: TauD/TfdA family dioxygenase [Novosphingobium sp.]|nr:TauD/TfdA family dioxygenase [Novosphingobium sp.]